MKFVFGATTRTGDEILRTDYHKVRSYHRLRRSYVDHHQWTVTARLVAANLSALKTQMALVAAIFNAGTTGDLSYTDDADVAITDHSITSDDTVYGVVCRGLSWIPTADISNVPGAKGEYAYTKGYRVSFEAETISALSNIVEWKESLQQYGGGGSNAHFATSLSGDPLAETLNAYTPIRMVQQGYSIGLESYVAYPDPLYPDSVVSALTRYGYESPIYYPNQSLMFGRNWTYVSIHQNTGDIPAGALSAPTF